MSPSRCAPGEDPKNDLQHIGQVGSVDNIREDISKECVADHGGEEEQESDDVEDEGPLDKGGEEERQGAHGRDVEQQRDEVDRVVAEAVDVKVAKGGRRGRGGGRGVGGEWQAQRDRDEETTESQTLECAQV